MFDTPITAKFFKKLELYLELKRQDRRVKKSQSQRGERIWSMEKCFLLWAIRGHWHLGTPLNPDYLKKVLKKDGFSDQDLIEVRQVAQNLVFKKFATKEEKEGYDKDTIQLTDTGFFMGEVIEEAQTWREYVYILFSIFVWLMVGWGFFEVINKILIVLKNIFLTWQ